MQAGPVCVAGGLYHSWCEGWYPSAPMPNSQHWSRLNTHKRGHTPPLITPCCLLQVGYIIPGVKDVRACRVGDTWHLAKNPPVQPLPGFKPVKPMVFAGACLGRGLGGGVVPVHHAIIVCLVGDTWHLAKSPPVQPLPGFKPVKPMVFAGTSLDWGLWGGGESSVHHAFIVCYVSDTWNLAKSRPVQPKENPAANTGASTHASTGVRGGKLQVQGCQCFAYSCNGTQSRLLGRVSGSKHRLSMLGQSTSIWCSAACLHPKQVHKLGHNC
jgi:hypothetical protein